MNSHRGGVCQIRRLRTVQAATATAGAMSRSRRPVCMGTVTYSAGAGVSVRITAR
jgi:hypothetical protein